MNCEFSHLTRGAACQQGSLRNSSTIIRFNGSSLLPHRSAWLGGHCVPPHGDGGRGNAIVQGWETGKGKWRVMRCLKEIQYSWTRKCDTVTLCYWYSSSSSASSIHPSVRPSVRPSVHPSIHPSVRPSVHPSVRLSVRPSVRPSIHPSIWKQTIKPSNHQTIIIIIIIIIIIHTFVT